MDPEAMQQQQVTLELCGYDAESGALLLTTRASECAASAIGMKRSRPQSYMRREFVDLQTWDRQLSRAHSQQEQEQERDDRVLSHEHATHASGPVTQRFERLPTRRVRKLMAQSWLKHDTACGWRIELQKNVAATEAWLNAAFRLLPLEQQRVFLDSEQYQQHKHERALARADAQHARDLQQYFTSQSLIDLTLARVAALLQPVVCGAFAQDSKSVDDPLESERIVWLEPSCGDGRFVAALLAAGAHRVVGVELDSALCTVARAAVREYAPARVEICESDFLASKRTDTRLAAAEEAGERDEQRRPPVVCAVGNPPFGDRVETASSTDLIQRFVVHAAREWRADVIAFIVPERCARTAYTSQTLAALASAEDRDAASDSSADRTRCAWRVALSEPLESAHFEFRSTKRIKQPSALVIYARSRCSDTSASDGHSRACSYRGDLDAVLRS